jgi:hypothetical protein
MKRFVGFFMGCAVGAVMVAAFYTAKLANLRDEIEASTKVAADTRLQDKYLASLIDVAHLGLMLRAVEPELIPEWFEEDLVLQSEELGTQYENSTLTGHAMRMIVGYFHKNNLQLPDKINKVFQDREQTSKWFAKHSREAIGSTFEERLAPFDAFMAKRARALREVSLNDPSEEFETTYDSFDLRSAVSY